MARKKYQPPRRWRKEIGPEEAERKEIADEVFAEGGLSYRLLLRLHPRIRDVARDRFSFGQPWDAVFGERSGLDLDGAALVRTAFSRNNPVLAFNALANQTDLDEQEGIMHLFEGAVLAIRNPGGHSFPEGSEQRAMECLSLLSLLAYRVQEAKLRKTP